MLATVLLQLSQWQPYQANCKDLRHTVLFMANTEIEEQQRITEEDYNSCIGDGRGSNDDN